MQLLVLGINHKTAQLSLRERLAFGPERIDEALAGLLALPGVHEGCILSTCNRTELYCVVEPGQQDALRQWWCRLQHVAQQELEPALYHYQEGEAVRHLMRVASGLDSLVLGEPQILGQLKEAFTRAQQQECARSLLGRLFQRAFAVAKRVRTETEIGANAVSVAYAAISLAKQIFADLAGLRVLLIGAGETIELAGRHLRAQQIGAMTVANRTLARAQVLASAWGADVITLDEIPLVLPSVDMVVSSTASPLPILGKGMLERALRARRHKPMLLIDLAVPRDVEAEVGELPDAYLYTVDDLQGIVAENQSTRLQAARQAEYLIEEERAAFMGWYHSLPSQEQIRAFRAQAHALQQIELARARQQLQQGEAAELVLAELAHRLTNKLIHAPTAALRQAGEAGDREALAILSQGLGLDPR